MVEFVLVGPHRVCVDVSEVAGVDAIILSENGEDHYFDIYLRNGGNLLRIDGFGKSYKAAAKERNRFLDEHLDCSDTDEEERHQRRKTLVEQWEEDKKTILTTPVVEVEGNEESEETNASEQPSGEIVVPS